MDIEFGDAGRLDTQGTGWFVGFSEWTRSPVAPSPQLRHMAPQQLLRGLCVKWMQHPAGDPRGTGKPLSTGRTLSIMVGAAGRFRLQFSEHDHFPATQTEEHLLQRPGEFCIWGAGIFHRYVVEADCTVLTLRWEPEA